MRLHDVALFGRTWLELLHLAGLTDLTDEEVRLYVAMAAGRQTGEETRS